MPFTVLGVELNYPVVATYADLPDATTHFEMVYIVVTATGLWPLNRKRAGLWRSDGVDWKRLGVSPTSEEIGALKSSPPDGYYLVTNFYVDPQTGKLWVDYDDGE